MLGRFGVRHSATVALGPSGGQLLQLGGWPLRRSTVTPRGLSSHSLPQYCGTQGPGRGRSANPPLLRSGTQPLRLLGHSALKLSRTWPPSCSALVLWHSISSPVRPLWRMASLSLSHSVDGCKLLRQQASALCHAQCFKAYLRLQLQLRPLRRPLWSSHAYSLCHSQLSTARLLGRSALQLKMPGARPLPVCCSGARLLVWSVHSSWHSCPRRLPAPALDLPRLLVTAGCSGSC